MNKQLKLAVLSALLLSVLVGGSLITNQPFKQVPPRNPSSGTSTNATQKSATPSQKSNRTYRSSVKSSPPSANIPARTSIVEEPAPVPLPDKRINNQIVTANGATYPLRVYKPLLTPNDPSATQWWTTQTGLPAAWGIGAGSRATTVAVIDSGFALSHEELSSRWALNAGEQGTTASQAASKLNCSDRTLSLNKSCNLIDDDFDGVVDNESGTTTIQNPSKRNCSDRGISLDKSCNNLDDDGNGYLDDVKGWDFSNFDANVQAGEVNPSGSNTVHGTMVSGVLGASGNNSKGIAGVNWSTKILPLQALDDEGYGDSLTVSRAVRYAADRGVDVISLSLGSNLGDSYLRLAVQYALDRGAVVVAAAGNDGCNCISYPANYPEVVAVGASTPSTTLASFSNYGPNLDILAPGQNMTSSTWSASNGTNAYASNIAGTSFSTPYVAGLLALERSWQPDASWGELVAALQENTNHAALSGGRNDQLGYGFTRADNALSRVSGSYSPLQQYAFSPLSRADTLGTMRAYQCEDGGLATAPLYQLTKGGQIHYTTSELQKLREAAAGWTAALRGYACIGLPTDTPQAVRTINLINEINGVSAKPLP